MSDADSAKIVQLLEQIRDNQTSLVEMARKQMERTERIQDRAEQLQTRSAGMIKTARITIAIILPVVIAAIAYLTWLMFR